MSDSGPPLPGALPDTRQENKSPRPNAQASDPEAKQEAASAASMDSSKRRQKPRKRSSLIHIMDSVSASFSRGRKMLSSENLPKAAAPRSPRRSSMSQDSGKGNPKNSPDRKPKEIRIVEDKPPEKKDPNKAIVHKGMMSKKRSKATVTVRGMQVILKEKDEKKEREKDELMERMQRRMGMGGVAAAENAGSVPPPQKPKTKAKAKVHSAITKIAAAKKMKDVAEESNRTISLTDGAAGGAEQIGGSGEGRAEGKTVTIGGLPEITKAEDGEGGEEEEEEEEEEKSIFSVDPYHPMAVVLRTVNTNNVWGKFRFLCILLVSAPDFELIVIILIFANCCSLAMLKPTLGKDAPWNMALDTVELVLNACFTFELVVRTVAVGGILTFLSYPWNLFDAAMVSIGYTQFLPTSGSGADSFRALRAIRALRPLRTITRFDSLRSVVVCFMEAIPLLASVASMLMFFLFLFGVCGVQLFGGVYHKACIDVDTGYQEVGNALEDSIGCGARKCPTDTEYNYTCQEIRTGTQINVAGFDNVGTALLTAFQITTLSNWNYVMYRTMDSAGGIAVLFYVLIVVLGTYFIMILFLAVLKLKFSKAQEMYTAAKGSADAGPVRDNTLVKGYKVMKTNFALMKQRYMEGRSPRSESSYDDAVTAASESEDVYVAKHIHRNKTAFGYPKFVYQNIKEQTRRLIMHKYFNNFFLLCILFNTVLLAIEFNGMPKAMAKALSDINFVLTQIFTLEVVLKMFGLGLATFFKDGFNIFDLMVVMLSQVEIILNIVFSSQGGSLSALRSLKTLRVLKSFRVLRVFKMFRYLESLRKIGEVLFNSMSSFLSIGILTLLFNVVFSIMGLHVYGEYKPDIGYPNFNTFINSCVLIFQVLTLEDWDLIAYSYVRETDYSTIAFFVAWIIVGKYIFLTLFLAVTLEAFESKYDSDTVEDVIEVMADEGDVNIDDIFEVAGVADHGNAPTEGSLDELDEFDGEPLEYHPHPGLKRQISRIHSPDAEEKRKSVEIWRRSEEQFGAEQIGLGQVREDAKVEVWRRSLDGSGSDLDDGNMNVIPVRRDTHDAMFIGHHGQSAWNGAFGVPGENAEIETAPWDESDAVRDWAANAPSEASHSNAIMETPVVPMLPMEWAAGDAHEDGMVVPLLGPDPDRPVAPAVGRRRSNAGPVAEAWGEEEEEADLQTHSRTPSLLKGKNFERTKTLLQRMASKRVSGGDSMSDEDGSADGSGRRKGILGRLSTFSAKRTETGFFRGLFSKGNLEQDVLDARKKRAEQEMKDARKMFAKDDEEDDDGNSSSRSTTRGEFPPLRGRSLWIFSPDMPLRVYLYRLVTTKTFDYVMFAFIILSCAAMVYEHPFIVTGSIEYQVMYWLEVIFTAVFGVEALFKIIAFGFQPYSKSMTNLVDLAIVVSSVLLLALESIADDLQAVKGLRVLRAAKPLRTLTRSQGMMLVFKSLSMSVMSMANVTIICLLFFAIFGILGTQLFGGDFYYCSQPFDIDGKMIDVRADCVGLGQDGDPLEWVNPYLNFDHLGNSLMTLFTTATLDGYADVMKLAMSVRGTDLQPMPGANAGAFLFFLFFIMIVAFCLLNLYVGVVFYQFSRIRMLSQAGAAFLTSDQREWMELTKLVLRLKPLDKVVVPKSRVRRYFYHMVIDNRFDLLMMTVIVANVVFMALEHYNMSLEVVDAIGKANYFFTAFFTMEAMLKITGLGWQVYIRSMWNKFDFFIVVASILDIALSFFESSFTQVVMIFRIQKMLRLLRISRMIKLVKSLKGVQSLFKTLIASLPAFSSVGALLMLLFFIYAYVGVLLFGTVRINTGMNHHANFQRFWNALNVLLRIATNDDWYLVMADCTSTPPDCSYELGDCGTPIAQWYFSSFVALASIIMLNLFTAVIIENFEKTQEQDSWKIVPGALEEFRELWSEYDDGTSTVSPHDLYDILTRLTPPLGLGPTTTNVELVRFVAMLDIPLNEVGRVPFHRTLYELVRRVSETSLPDGNMKDALDMMVEEAFEAMNNDDELMSFNIAIIVMRVQRKWRAVVRSRKVAKAMQRRMQRAMGFSTMKDLIDKKSSIMADVSLSKMEGKPWVFDSSPGLGKLSAWALNKDRKRTISDSSTPALSSFRATGLGMGRRMTMLFGGARRATKVGAAASAPSSGTYSAAADATQQQPPPGGLANMMKRVTRLGGQKQPVKQLQSGRTSAGAQAALDALSRNTLDAGPAEISLEQMAMQALGDIDESDSDSSDDNSAAGGDDAATNLLSPIPDTES